MKKKILITNGHLKTGGVEKSLVNFLRAIDYSKHDVDLLLFEGTGEYLPEIPEEVNIKLCDLSQTYGSFFHVIKNNLSDYEIIKRKIITTLATKLNQKYLKYLIELGEYDVALAYRVGMPMDYVSYGVNARKKYFWWHHGEFNYPDTIVKHWQDSARHMDGMICVSNTIKNVVKSYFEPYVKEILVIPNMIYVRKITTETNKRHQSDGSNMIVSVGRFSEEKHMGDCVSAAKELTKKGYHNLRWYLLGDGPEKEQVQNEIISEGLQDKIFCLGNVADPYTYMKNADLIVHPSYVESQGMTVLEAMALHKLIVAVGSDGVKEYAVDHENALIAEKNLDSLVDKIEEALNMSENDKIKICETAKKTAEKYRSEAIMKQIERDLFADQ